MFSDTYLFPCLLKQKEQVILGAAGQDRPCSRVCAIPMAAEVTGGCAGFPAGAGEQSCKTKLGFTGRRKMVFQDAVHSVCKEGHFPVSQR